MKYKKQDLPDVASDALAQRSSTLQWAGMEAIDVPISLEVAPAHTERLSAKANIYVSIDDTAARGIHMSRLHRRLNQLGDQACNKHALDSLLDACITSQAGISESARIELSFDLLLNKPALLSGESGYQAYETNISGQILKGRRSYKLGLTIPYSSTCPCSAALSRQLYAEAVDEQFDSDHIDKAALLEWIQSAQGSVATPHAQRSYAYLELGMEDSAWPDFADLIEQLESVIGTPVQTAVKREDEQEFARLNAANLMFCEDAARRIKRFLEDLPGVADYWFKVEHQESLHAHNAVAIDWKRSEG
ncbi:MAG: GTP cyclohydrolase FolE2 [Pseudomonadota bacterium]